MGWAKLVRISHRMLQCHCLICFGKLCDMPTVKSNGSINCKPLLDNASDVNYINYRTNYTVLLKMTLCVVFMT